MAIFKLFSDRQKEGKDSDPLQYAFFSEKLRTQLVLVFMKSMGNYDTSRGDPFSQNYYSTNELWELVFEAILHEKGKFHLTKPSHDIPEQISNYILAEKEDDVLDVVELLLKTINILIRERISENQFRNYGITISPDEAIEEINHRFLSNGVGYSFENNQIVRVDSKFMHSQVITTAIHLLKNGNFKSAEEEFMKGFEHYKMSRYIEACNEFAKSLESVLKIILTKKKISINKANGLNDLLRLLFENNILPTFYQEYFNNLKGLIAGGTSVPRNKSSAHGAGPEKTDVPEELVRFLMHSSASSIIFLSELSSKK